MNTKRVSDWRVGVFLLALVAPTLSFAQSADGGAYGQLKDAASHPATAAAVDAGNSTPVTKPLASVSTGEMCIRRGGKPKLTPAQKQAMKAYLKKALQRYGQEARGAK